MNFQRTALLLVAILALTAGIALWLQDGAKSLTYSGILIRVGLMLSALCLAYPQLENLRNRLSLFTFGLVGFMLLLVAARPRIFPIAAGVALGSILLNGLLRKLSGKLPKQ